MTETFVKWMAMKWEKKKNKLKIKKKKIKLKLIKCKIIENTSILRLVNYSTSFLVRFS